MIRDESGGVVSGVHVTATNTATSLARSVTSDSAGYYSLPPIPADIYDVKAELPGFATAVRKNQTFHVGTTISLDFTLKPAAVAETIEVVTEAPVLETTKNTLSRLVQKSEIDSMPVITRNFNALAALAPGVTAGVTAGATATGGVFGGVGGVDISGSRDFQNGYNVDGASSEAQLIGTQRIIYSQDWIQEFQVLTSQFTAEFGLASGGILNAITRSGSNQWSGRVYGFFRNEKWDAIPNFATSKPPLDEKRLGATLGGRLIKDRLFFFAGFEWFKNESSNIVQSGFPSANGTFPSEIDEKVFMAKLNYTPSASSTFLLRYNGQHQDTSGQFIGGLLTEEHGRFQKLKANDVVGSWTKIISPSLFNEARASFGNVDPRGGCNFAERNPKGTWFERNFLGTGVFGCPVNFGRIAEDQVQLFDNISWIRGKHEVKAGVQALRARYHGDFRNFRDGLYVFPGPPFSLANPATYPFALLVIEGPTTFDFSGWSYGAFLQDSWRLSTDFTLNLGVRYDLDSSFTALNELVRVDKGLNTFDKDTNNIAPRVGFAWTPFGNDKKTLIRGGGGIYYDQNHNNSVGIVLVNTILVDRFILINAFQPGLNPFGNVDVARQFLAEAFARNTIPDASRIPGLVVAADNIDQGLQVPGTAQASLGVAHDFKGGVSASADFVYAHGFDQLIYRDVNLDRNAALNENRIVRLNPNFTSIFSLGNEGEFDYRALQIQATYSPNARHLAKLAYTLAKNESNTFTILTGGGATNPFNLEEDRGPTANDVRHTLSLNGFTTLPLDIQLGAILYYRSALPYSAIVAGRQLDADPFPDRPEPRNDRPGDRFFSLDARLSKTVRLGGRRSVTAFVEGFNLTNATSFGFYVGNIDLPTFGTPVTAFPKRRVQLGFRADF